ncbi:glutathione S-transferase family protein [Mangrovicella endophytica]|uniref:glutathione S-transferase family protein n=1 Tax=Mangrovicella endophytica TaxID=2066697 RepID=UPI000C9E6480|nr:glutathione S-transferase family protein [Mangrovicella endophytica]
MSIVLYELAGADSHRPFSPHCWKARMALKHKGLVFDTVSVAFTEVPTIENGATRAVPLIRDGGTLVSDSFRIAEYLEEAYPDLPSLFGGQGGRDLTRFVESWTQLTLHPAITGLAITDIHAMLAEPDQVYFRADRERKLGRSLEAVASGREDRIEPLLKSMEPLRSLLRGRPFIGGNAPLFADYIVFGALQWLRITCPLAVVPTEDPVALWFGRCLDLFDGHGRTVSAASA